MFTSKVYTVSIPSSGIVLEEERIAREVINRWSLENGKKAGAVLLPIPSDCKDITPDIYIFTIDNYVDQAKVEAAVASGAIVFLFFRKYHDADNTMATELQTVAALRTSIKVICVDYGSLEDFKEALIQAIESYIAKQ